MLWACPVSRLSWCKAVRSYAVLAGSNWTIFFLKPRLSVYLAPLTPGKPCVMLYVSVPQFKPAKQGWHWPQQQIWKHIAFTACKTGIKNQCIGLCWANKTCQNCWTSFQPACTHLVILLGRQSWIRRVPLYCLARWQVHWTSTGDLRVPYQCL